MELVTKMCPNCHNFIYCPKDEDTKCQMCNTFVWRSTPNSTPTRAPDCLLQLYTPTGSIHIEHVMPNELPVLRGTDADTQQQRIKELEAINAEMLEALEAMLREYKRLMTRAGVDKSAYFRGFASGARAAIAKAKGA